MERSSDKSFQTYKFAHREKIIFSMSAADSANLLQESVKLGMRESILLMSASAGIVNRAPSLCRWIYALTVCQDPAMQDL